MDHLSFIQSKILLDRSELENILSVWNFKDLKVVFTNGCFDIIHRGHVEYLAKAASLGDHLVIGLNTDASVKRLKGSSRPVQDQNTRDFVILEPGLITKKKCFRKIRHLRFMFAESPY